MNRKYNKYYHLNKVGIKKYHNKIVLPAIYDSIDCFSDGVFTVRLDEKTIYIDNYGTKLLEYSDEYDNYGCFNQGLAKVMKKSKWGFINRKGKEIVKPMFFYVDQFSGGLCIVGDKELKHGLINKKGDFILNFQKEKISRFIDGYASVGTKGKYGIIDVKLEIILPKRYESVQVHENGKARITEKNGELLREGLYQIGETIIWNKRMDRLNELRRKSSEFSKAITDYLELIFTTSCPCQNPNFKQYIQWRDSIPFVDQEILYTEFSEYLIRENDQSKLTCPKCKTEYKEIWNQYSVFHYVLNVEVITEFEIDSINKKACKVPYFIGFKGRVDDRLYGDYEESDISKVIDYLM